jgi:hypothetical protein
MRMSSNRSQVEIERYAFCSSSLQLDLARSLQTSATTATRQVGDGVTQQGSRTRIENKFRERNRVEETRSTHPGFLPLCLPLQPS